jgi:ABC-type polysaccharide/polyol phosphate transport system ATPase subunit
MRESIDISFRSVSKRYLIRPTATSHPNTPHSFNWLARLVRGREPRQEFWAVKDVSFSVPRGEALGIIGHNGAGKSTLLKMLSGITAPTAGEISLRGRFSALLEVGSGFHPDLTGRENIFLSGSVLGMSRSEIRRKLDSIVDFSGIASFIDTPVKRYSSGMFVRLGFSIAAHLDPDILLLDEVLAVGDRQFQEKCKQRIARLHGDGATIIFISHDLAAVEDLCQRVILLERGRIAAAGAPEHVIRKYTESANLTHTPSGPHGKPAQITGVAFFDESGRRCAGFETGRPIRCRVDYAAAQEIRDAALFVNFNHSHGWPTSQWTTIHDGPSFSIRPGKGCVEFSCAELGLQPGVYKIDVHIEDARAGRTLEEQPRCTSIHVRAGKKVQGTFYSPHRWRKISPAERVQTA